jgi:adenosine deaminase
MVQFIRLARDYSQEIVGIDFYGQEDDCRKYWHEFRKYIKVLRHYHIRYQASMNNYKDLQLIEDVIKGLGIERLCEAYEAALSSKSMENILIKHGVCLVICPISNAYAIANHQVNDTLLEIGKKRKYQSTSSLDNLVNEKELSSYNLMNYLQSELINYSITSLSPIQYKQNLSFIYKDLFEKNKDFFTCEHVSSQMIKLYT